MFFMYSIIHYFTFYYFSIRLKKIRGTSQAEIYNNNSVFSLKIRHLRLRKNLRFFIIYNKKYFKYYNYYSTLYINNITLSIYIYIGFIFHFLFLGLKGS